MKLLTSLYPGYQSLKKKTEERKIKEERKIFLSSFIYFFFEAVVPRVISLGVPLDLILVGDVPFKPILRKSIPDFIRIFLKSIPDLIFHSKILKIGTVPYIKIVKIDTVPYTNIWKNDTLPGARGGGGDYHTCRYGMCHFLGCLFSSRK